MPANPSGYERWSAVHHLLQQVSGCRLPLESYDRQVDRVVDQQFATNARIPDVLYHYTSLGGLRGILADRAFRATDHRQTNDDRELRSAEEAIELVTTGLATSASGARADVLRHFNAFYPKRRVADHVVVYLACFTAQRDSDIHWANYADAGQGVCIGLRVLRDETLPNIPYSGAGLHRVQYDRDALEAAIVGGFQDVLRAHDRFMTVGWPPPVDRRAKAIAVSGLARVAAMAGICAKDPQKWAAEEEWRLVVLRHGEAPLPVQVSESGRRFVLHPIRALGKLLAISEIIAGPASPPETIQAVDSILQDAGYPADDAPRPPVIRSRALGGP